MGWKWVRTGLIFVALPLFALLGLAFWLWFMHGYAYFMTGPGYTAVVGTGGVDYELPGPYLEENSQGRFLYWRTVRWTLKVDENFHVLLNGVGYGSISPGDKVKMTWEGRMFVNGVQRTPESGIDK